MRENNRQEAPTRDQLQKLDCLNIPACMTVFNQLGELIALW